MMLPKKNWGAIVCLIFSLYASNSIAQSQEKVYGVMMVNFAKGMQWPSKMLAQEFVIGVLEYPPLASELVALAANVKVGNKKLRVIEFDSPEDVKQCHMLFVPAYKTKRLAEVIEKLGGYATVVITNKIDYARKGAGINFVLIDGKLRYEINSRVIEKSGIKVSSDIKGLGIQVD